MTREEAIDVLRHNYPSSCFTELCEAVEIAIQALSVQPAADVAPVRHGRWGKAEQRGCVAYSGAYAECSICHGEPVFMAHHMAFCPHCGAQMDGGDGDGE